ncbi:PucR family transcriptional regulator [Actinomadura hibisca]|uniref:PucR family transcriptional regulator n=1 Tax=Actinomadura hibisca TaxID=68565 RepID=UPI00082FD984|nr:helix-turn-helix domain-containing protein [Actinomadura hibisca]
MTVTDGRTGSDIMRRAARRLADRLPDLADTLVGEILAGEEWDRPAGLREDLWQVAHTGLGHGMTAILDPGAGRADLSWARELGRRRAEQGQPLDLLLRSYRLAGRVFWEAVVEIVAQDDPAYVPVLVRHAGRTWHTIDEQSSAAAAAYHRTEYDLLRRSEERVQAVVDALLDGRGAEGGTPAAAPEILGLPARGRYAVVVLGPAAVRPPDAAGARCLWRTRADGTQVALVALGAASLDELAAALRPHVRVPAGISPVVDTLAELGTARWLAELALRTCRPGEIALLDRCLPDALVISQPRLAGRLGRSVLGPLLDLDDAYREVLLTTLATWLECEGSASRAATRLYCHHNTVLNRLRRVERLTGRMLSDPNALVELVLALSAARLLKDATPRA